VYRIVPDQTTIPQVAALPIEALNDYAEVLAAVALTPWNGQPQHEDNPDGSVRWWAFGEGQAGQVVYLILDDQRKVHLVLVQWCG